MASQPRSGSWDCPRGSMSQDGDLQHIWEHFLYSLVGPEVLSRLSTAGRWQGLLGLSESRAQHLSRLPSVLGHLSLGRKQSPKETGRMCALAGRVGRARSSTTSADISSSSSSPHAGTGCAGKSGSTTFLPRLLDASC